MSDLYTNSGAAPSEERVAKVSHVREEARAAILAEQLTYLLEHAGSCPPNCPECSRLRKVEEMLLRPFRVHVYNPAA